MSPEFWLGTHEVGWLRRTGLPLFISATRLRRRKILPRALGPWALDSGGFTELSLYGEWRTSAMQYSCEVRQWSAAIGGLAWAAAQDWMCEPSVRVKTGFTTADHQRLTVANYLLLRRLAPEVAWVPVLQGWEFDDYLDHVGWTAGTAGVRWWIRMRGSEGIPRGRRPPWGGSRGLWASTGRLAGDAPASAPAGCA